jgi:hypothetical protein
MLITFNFSVTLSKQKVTIDLSTLETDEIIQTTTTHMSKRHTKEGK